MLEQTGVLYSKVSLVKGTFTESVVVNGEVSSEFVFVSLYPCILVSLDPWIFVPLVWFFVILQFLLPLPCLCRSQTHTRLAEKALDTYLHKRTRLKLRKYFGYCGKQLAENLIARNVAVGLRVFPAHQQETKKASRPTSK